MSFPRFPSFSVFEHKDVSVVPRAVHVVVGSSMAWPRAHGTASWARQLRWLNAESSHDQRYFEVWPIFYQTPSIWLCWAMTSVRRFFAVPPSQVTHSFPGIELHLPAIRFHGAVFTSLCPALRGFRVLPPRHPAALACVCVSEVVFLGCLQWDKLPGLGMSPFPEVAGLQLRKGY